jgi:hypothetical protein
MFGAFVGLLSQGGGLPHAWGWIAALAVLWVVKP